MTVTRPPVWFRIVVALLIVWGLIGVGMFHASLTAGFRARLEPFDRHLYESWPVWYAPVYGIAVWSGLLGSVLLAARRRLARSLYSVSLVAIVVMFGWTFVATDLIAVKGWVVATAFPLVIALVCAAEIRLAGLAVRRGWIG